MQANAARVVIEALQQRARRVGKYDRLAAVLEADQRRRVFLRSLVLHGNADSVVASDGKVTDAEEAIVQGVGGTQRASVGVDVCQRRRHGGDVQLFARGIGVGANSAVSDDEGPSVPEENKFVGSDAVRWHFPHPSQGFTVADTNHANAVFEVVLGRKEIPAVVAVHTVSIEVAVIGAMHYALDLSLRQIDFVQQFSGAPSNDNGDVAACRVSH